MDAPPAPRTPSPNARRLLFSYPPTHSLAAAVGVVALVLGLFVFRIFGRGVPTDIVLTVFGSKTTGTLVSQSDDPYMTVDHVHPMRFEFSYAVSGATFAGKSYAMRPAYGSKVDVEYLSFAPESARVVGTTRNEGGDSIGWLMGAMMAFGSCGIALPWWAMRRKRRAFERGAVAQGVVTFVGESSYSINGRSPKQIAWTFQDDRNRTFGGSLSAFMSSDLPPLTDGQSVTILYDRDDPTANIVFIE